MFGLPSSSKAVVLKLKDSPEQKLQYPCDAKCSSYKQMQNKRKIRKT